MSDYIEREAAEELISQPITMSLCLTREECLAKRSQRDIDVAILHSVPVPPHGRLIDAEPIMKYITDGLNSVDLGYDAIKVMTEIEYAPTIIPAEEDET